VNQLAVKASGMAAWGAFMSDDGRDGTMNPIGRLMFNSDKTDAATGRPTRATTAGEVRVPTWGKATFVTLGLAVWNVSLCDISKISISSNNGIPNYRYRDINSYITHGCVIALKSSAENVNYFIYIKKNYLNYGNYFRNSKNIIVLF
jgi:hypothetical protein